MVKRKIMFAGLVAVFAVLVVSSFVSAGIGDFIKGLFGDDPELSPFNATVTVQGVAPTVPFVFNITDNLGTTPINSVDVTQASQTDVIVTFLASDDNGVSDLPSQGTGNPLNSGDASLQIVYGGSHADTVAGTGSINIDGTSCEHVACVDAGCSGIEQMYVCTFTDAMDYYFQPNVNLSAANPSLWTVAITINGADGSGSNNTFNWTYQEQTYVSNFVNLTWFAVDPSASLQTATDNVTVRNDGNSFVDLVNITSFNLTGDSFPGDPDAYIPSQAVRSLDGIEGDECADPPATTLNDAEGLYVSMGLDFGSGLPTRELNFCLYPQLNTLLLGNINLGDSPYIAVNGRTGTDDWRLSL